MTTPTTPEHARGIAAHMMQTSPLYVAYMSLADQVEALTKERDEYAKAADTMAMQHKVERDALAMANRDLINWFDALKADHDKLAADAARYCWMTEHIVSGELEALEKAFTTIGEEKESITQAEFDAVIDAAIQEAGVQ